MRGKVFGGRRPAAFLLASLLLLSYSSQAQVSAPRDSTLSLSPSNNVPKGITWYRFFERIPEDWSEWGSVSFAKDQANMWAGVTLSTVLLYFADDPIYTPSQKLYNSDANAKRWADNFAAMGDGRTQFALAGAYAAYGILFKDERAFKTGSEIVEVVLASGAVIQVLKHVTGRESPFVRSTPTGRWSLFPNQVDYHRYVPRFDAFPSGHICTSIGTVVVIAENYPDVVWIRPVGYTLTALVGIGMGTNGIHWYSDYPLGLFIGYTFGMIAAHPEWYESRMHASVGKLNLSVTPTYSALNGTGIALTVRF